MHQEVFHMANNDKYPYVREEENRWNRNEAGIIIIWLCVCTVNVDWSWNRGVYVGVGVKLCMCDSGAIVFSVYPAVYFNNVVFKN
jgi:hypothetical protein